MKKKRILHSVAMIYGIIVTLLMLLAIGSKIIEQVVQKGFITVMKEIGEQFILWDDPSAFFVTYIIGYAVIWWKPLWGSIIIITGSLVYFVMEPNPWALIFILPAFLVGLLYLLTWYIKRRKT
jgi:hypothetical protein